MDIYTSYYAKAMKTDTTGMLLVQVSNSKPKWFTKPVYNCVNVHPPWSLVDGYKKGHISEEQFTKEYNEYLDGQNVDFYKKLLEDTCGMEGFDKVVLLCWETGFCHRRILGERLGCKGEL